MEKRLSLECVISVTTVRSIHLIKYQQQQQQLELAEARSKVVLARAGSIVRQSRHYGPSFIVRITPAGPIFAGQAAVLDQFSMAFGSVVRTIHHSTNPTCRQPSSSLAWQDAVLGQSSTAYDLCAVACM